MSKEIRPPRTNINQTPCLQDRSLQCLSECQAFNEDTRRKILDEVSQDLPPWTDVFSFKVRGELGNARQDQDEAQRRYNEEMQALRAGYCTIAFALGILSTLKTLE